MAAVPDLSGERTSPDLVAFVGNPRAVLQWYDFLCLCRVIEPSAFRSFHKGLVDAHFVLGEDLGDLAVIDIQLQR